MEFPKYTNVSVEASLELQKSDARGISEKEAVVRLKEYGFNEIKPKGINVLEILWRQISSPFCYLILLASLISFFIGEIPDSMVLLTYVAVNIIIGFIYEFKAEHSIVLLRNFIPQKVTVLRGGKPVATEKRMLVPGDIVLLQTGDIAPADMRVLEATSFLINESSLTGESLPVAKNVTPSKRLETEVFQATNIIFTGTSVISGKAEGLVVATAKETVFGGITESISGIRRESTYEKSILYFSGLILKIVLVTIALIFAANIFLKGPGDIFELVLFSVALIVSILPDALPVVITFALSQGSIRMAKQNVVVKRLPAIEDLGNVEVLCTDKTGTLTKNQLSLEKIISSDQSKLLLYGLLASSDVSQNIDPFDAAVRKKVSRDIVVQEKKYAKLFELPFDSYRMRSAFLAQSPNGDKLLIVKGAPESILQNSSKFSGKFSKKEVKDDIAREGNEGRRVLALAYKKIAKTKNTIKLSDEKGLTFLGYFVFEDPLKSSAKESIELSKRLGLQVKIITGDSLEVAAFIGKKIGLATGENDTISGKELKALTREEFDDACESNSVFARISPDIKYAIIKSLQRKFEVGFIGDGVNDAPALKKSDVGIAVAGASDVAKEAADVVLLQKDLRVIVNGIKDGREIFANVNKYIKTTLANNFGDFYSIAIISLFINFLPMLPVQILLGDLLSDFPLISIASDTVDPEELRRPKAYQLHNVLPLIVSLGLVATIFDFIFYLIVRNQQVPVIQTLWFVETIFTEIFLVFVMRTTHQFWKTKRPSNLLIFFTIFSGILIVGLPFMPFAHEWFHFVTPPIPELLLVFVLTVFYFAASEGVKLVYFKYFRPKEESLTHKVKPGMVKP
jgi:Mg2+-importing ATPase